MKKQLLILLYFLTLFVPTYGQQVAKTLDGKNILLYDDGTWLYADSVLLQNIKASNIYKLEIPQTNPKDNVINHTGFSLLYNETHEQASWVAYQLTNEETIKIAERTDKFIIDPKVKSGSASDKDYEGSGFDRGHLAPASDMGWSSTTMAESFYYSNMSPQSPSFNRGIWKKLEELVRTWAVENEAVYIVTGPVLISGLQSIGPNKVSIPNYYYKVILDYSDPNIKGIGFILPNVGSTMNLQNYAVSIDSVERFTGINFFPLLSDDQEKLIEKSLCIKCWSWKSVKTTIEKNNDNKGTASVQCEGITKAGARCKNKTLNLNKHCHHHENQINSSIQYKRETVTSPSTTPRNSNSTSVQCSGTTKAGQRCKRRTTSSSGRCHQH